MTGDIRRRPRRARSVATIFAVAAMLATVLAPTGAAADVAISLAPVVSGLASPTQITNANDGTDRLFVVEQRGTIRVIQGGVIQPGYFLDIRSKVAAGGERGLLGLAFHPQFKTNRYFFVYYTRNGGDVVVSRFRANEARTAASASTHHPLLLIEHSAQSNHNGGGLAFSPIDHYLYVAVGDGGGTGDPGNDAQETTTTFLGKILRINVNGTGSGRFDHYSIPKSNPFYGPIRGRGEIWAYGLRNPWRISFDRATGKLFIADVGQGRYEEIDREKVGIKGGRNYGWNAMEGMHCYIARKCPLAGDTQPNVEYSHAGGNCAVTGGYVYRGPTQTALRGLYVFGDWCSGRIWTVPYDGPAVNQPETLRADTSLNITSFGESENGELYLVSSAGGVYQVRAS
jgi:glucose/arabinose dehydrogenase